MGNPFVVCPMTREECGPGYEGYLDTIVRPMSLSMMRRILDAKEYATVNMH